LQISLLLPEISLLSKIVSLLIVAGNLPGNRCGTGAFRTDVASKSPEIAKIPVNFPVSRELQAETGSYLTAHTTKLFKHLAIWSTRKPAAVYTSVDRFVLFSSLSTAASAN
jgi:hypothetical protein